MAGGDDTPRQARMKDGSRRQSGGEEGGGTNSRCVREMKNEGEGEQERGEAAGRETEGREKRRQRETEFQKGKQMHYRLVLTNLLCLLPDRARSAIQVQTERKLSLRRS